MSFLTLWAYSSDDVFEILTRSDLFVPWLKRITIEASEVGMRLLLSILFAVINDVNSRYQLLILV